MDSKTFVLATILFVSSPSFALNGSECKTAGALQEFRLQDDSFAGAVVKSRGADCDIVSVKTYIYECRAFNWKYTGQMGREVFVVHEHGEDVFSSYRLTDAEDIMARLSCAGELEE